jgi:hypothetical protein
MQRREYLVMVDGESAKAGVRNPAQSETHAPHDGFGSRASIEDAGTIQEPCYRSSLTCGPAPRWPADARSVP